MRSRALAAALLSLSLLSACGDDEPQRVASPSASEAEEPGTTAAPEAGGIDAAQLDAEDLGEDWELTATTPASEDPEKATPLDECLPGDLPVRLNAGQDAESDERKFTLDGEADIPSEVISYSVSMTDEALLAELHEVLRGKDFRTCIGDTFRDVLEAQGAEPEVGEVEAGKDVVDPGEAEALDSTGLTLAIGIKGPGQTVALRANVTFLSTGSKGAWITYFGVEDELLEESIAEWGRSLAERLADA